jgi:hypothetical protein
MLDFGFERPQATLALFLAENCIEDALELITQHDLAQLEALVQIKNA